MLRTAINRSAANAATGERRDVARVPCSKEIILSWNHNLGQRIRFRLVDQSEDGLRIAGTLPILSGLTGVAISILPDGVDVNRVFSVNWASEHPVQGEYHAGLQFLG